MSGLVENFGMPTRRDPYAVPPERDWKWFPDVVHDFVAECLEVRPDWDFLRWRRGQFAMAREDTAGRLRGAIGMTRERDWEYVLCTADSHQSNGPVRCRMLDGRLADLLPNDNYKGRLVRDRDVTLDQEARHPYWDECSAFLRVLEDMGHTYGVYAGPMQYSPLNLPTFPRRWADLELDVNLTTDEEVETLAAAVGATATRWLARWWELRMPGGTVMGLNLPRPEVDTIDGHTFHAWDRPLQRLEVFGTEMWAPDPVMYVMRAGWHTWNAVAGSAAPLTLWALARMKLWASLPSFSWEGLGEQIRRSIEAWWALPVENPWGDEDMHRADAAGYRVLWTLGLAHEAYGVYPEGITPEGLAAPYPVLEPVPDTAGRTMKDREAAYVGTCCEWTHRPAMEDFLFRYYTRGLQDRLAVGLWRRRPARPQMMFLIRPNGRPENHAVPDDAPPQSDL